MATRDDIIKGALRFAKTIADGNQYGYKRFSDSHNSTLCPICNPGSGNGWNCIGFVTAAYTHGGGLGDRIECNNAGLGYNSFFDYGLTLDVWNARNGHCWDEVSPGRPAYLSTSQLQPGDVLIGYSGGKSQHVYMYYGNGLIVDDKTDTIPWNDQISFSRYSEYDDYAVRAFRLSSNNRYFTNVKVSNEYKAIISDAFAGGDSSGPGVDLGIAISKLWSSDNYERVYEDKLSKTKELQTKFKDDIQKILNNSFTPSTVDGTYTAAILESVVENTVKELAFDTQKPKKLSKSRGASLTSFPSLVEAPTIVLDFNGIKIGGYGNVGDKYPNYISNMKVNKINGRINNYTINLTYQVRPNEDPNFIDKLISRTGYTKPLRILYGDSNSSGSYYREESAVIVDVKQTENVKAYTVNYAIKAISSIGVAQTSLKTYKSRKAKPSTVIYDLLYNSGESSDAIMNLFPGMKNRLEVSSKNLIPTNDAEIQIGGMENVSPLTYLEYLVSCMSNPMDTKSSYYLSYIDDSLSEFGGSYFKIAEVRKFDSSQNESTITDSIVYELDINYPTNNFITNFQLCNNNYWSLVYEYAGEISKYDYDIDNDGNLIENKTNILYNNNKYSESSIIDSNWWKQVTEFPITAKVTLKGLVSPIMLTSYVRVNTFFYGRKDISSGLYVVTQQEDTISGSGYSTELTLLRVAED